MNTILLGTFVSLIGVCITAFGVFKNSQVPLPNPKDIQQTREQPNTQPQKQAADTAELEKHNTSLKSTIEILNEKVAKQALTIIELSKQKEHLPQQHPKPTENVVRNVTSVSSYCETRIIPISNQAAKLSFVQHGKEPIYDLSVKIVDLELLSKIETKTPSEIRPSDWENCQVIIPLGNMQAESTLTYYDLYADFGKDAKSFNVFYNTRNSFFTQQIRLHKVGESWATATRVISGNNSNKLLFEKVDSNFPMDSLKWD